MLPVYFRIIISILLSVSFQISFAGFKNSGNYILITEQDYRLKVIRNENLVLKKYIVFDEYIRDASLSVDEENEQVKINSIFSLIKKRKYAKVAEYIKSQKNAGNADYLLFGIFYFFCDDYLTAIDYLSKYKGEEFKFLQLLLVADSNYQQLSQKDNYKKVLSYYQHALDATGLEWQRNIIRSRIKLIKYSE